MAANLLVIQGTDDGLRFELSDTAISMGRGLGCDLRLNDSEVSRVHVRIEESPEGYRLLDQGSANGTLVNGQAVDVHVLRNGDQIQIGRTVLVFDADLSDLDMIPQDGQVRFVDADGDESQIVNRIAPDDTRTFVRPDVSEPAASPAQLTLLQTLFRVSEETSHATAPLEQILQSVLDLTLAATQADRGCVLLNDSQTDRMSPASSSSRDPLTAGPMTVSRTIVNHVASERQGVRTSDAQTDTRFATGNSIIASGIREAICVPMVGLAEFIGVIYLHTISPADNLVEQEQHQHALTDQHLKLVLAVGRQIAITIERRRYQQALLKAERFAAVGQTITMLSHHVKNILQGVRGGSYLIETGLVQSDNEIVRQGWGIVDRNQTRIYNLVMDMLTYSTEKKPVLAQASLNEVVSEVCELMKGRAAEYSVSLSFEPGLDVPESAFDSHGIHRAVLNIVTNAIEAVEGTDDAQVSIATGSSSAGLVVAIRDNGPGIPEEQKEKLFHLFESNKGTRGTGLGLAVSRKIMDEHGGWIEVESEPPNGTMFRLLLPRLDAAGPTNC